MEGTIHVLTVGAVCGLDNLQEGKEGDQYLKNKRCHTGFDVYVVSIINFCDRNTL
ncbi:hypothetical protein LMG33818_001780 [Halomonadaceae bacterium LMG 33818]